LKEGISQKMDAEAVAVVEPTEVHLEAALRLPETSHSSRTVRTKTMEDKNLTDMVKTKDPESSKMTKADHA
jgi:hypothetical protein